MAEDDNMQDSNQHSPDDGQNDDALADGQGTHDDQHDDGVPENIKQYFKSGFGRLQADMTDRFDQFQTSLNQRQVPPYVPNIDGNINDPRAAINQSLSDKLFQGDILGVFQAVSQIQQNVAKTMSQQNEQKLKKALVEYRDKEGYEQLYPHIESEARKAMSRGYTPEHAAELAYLNALNLSRSNPDGIEGLNLMGSGRRQPRKRKQPQLPPEHLKAAQRAIKDKLFKDMDDYIENGMSPVLKKQLGFIE